MTDRTLKKCKNLKCSNEIPKGVRSYCCTNCSREAKAIRDASKPPKPPKLCKHCQEPLENRQWTYHTKCKLKVYKQKELSTKTLKGKKRRIIKATRIRVMSLAKKIVRLRDDYTCQYLIDVEPEKAKVSGSNCQCSHVIPVSADKRLQYDPLNMKILSYHWHLNWWHKNPVESGIWFKEKFPERWEYLQAKHKENQNKGTIHLSELEEIEKNLLGQLKELESK